MKIERIYNIELSGEEFKTLVNAINIQDYKCDYSVTNSNEISYKLLIDEEEFERLTEDLDEVIYHIEDEFGYTATIDLRELRFEFYEALNM